MKDFITISYFQRGQIVIDDFRKSDKETLLNVNHISEISEITEINDYKNFYKYFTITMSNGNRYFIKPEHRSKLSESLK